MIILKIGLVAKVSHHFLASEIVLSQEKIKDALRSFGLAQKEADMYILLAKGGPLKGGEIARHMKRNKGQVYRLLKILQKKGLVESTLESPTRFVAVPFKTVIDLFVKKKQDEVALIEESTKDLLNDWSKINKTTINPSLEKFIVINGTHKILNRISKMINETKSQLFSISTVQELLRADQMGFFDAIFDNKLGSKIQFRFLTDLSDQEVNAMKNLLERIPKAGVNVKGRNPELGLNMFPRMVIRDNEEILFSITPKTNTTSSSQDDVSLWTNCQSLIQSFSSVFEELWRNATNIENKINEIQTLKSTNKTNPITDAKTVKNKFLERMNLVKKEIIMLTSSENLINLWKNKTLCEKWSKQDISVKIMAPLTSKNKEAAKQLSQFIEVRHYPVSYLETTIIDRKHLFQFKIPISSHEKPKPTSHFRDALYTDNLDHIKKTRDTLNDLWKNANPPSAITLESINVPYGFKPTSFYPPLRKIKGMALFAKDLGKITEKDVLNKIIKDGTITEKPLNGIGKMYSSSATAIIHPPKKFKLPDMMISIDHIDKRSSFGQGDALMIYLKTEMPGGHLFVPAGGIGDNPRGVEHRKKVQFTDKNARENYRLVKKEELQVRVHGNMMFAGWTVPIPLFPKCTLPPACIMIEGYGNVKTRAHTAIGLSGYKTEMQSNYLNAFVTFMHPKSKYSGPGTDGLFFRDLVATTYSPEK